MQEIYSVDEQRGAGTFEGKVSGRFTITDFSSETSIKPLSQANIKRGISQVIDLQTSNQLNKRQKSESSNKNTTSLFVPPTPIATKQAPLKASLPSNENISDTIRVSNCSEHVTVNDLQRFFSGLSFQSFLLCCYQSHDSPKEIKYAVYVKFNTLEGAKLALVRSGESLSTSQTSTQTRITLETTDIIEAYFAFHLGIQMTENISLSTILDGMEDMIPSLSDSTVMSSLDLITKSYYQSYCEYECAPIEKGKFIEYLDPILKNDFGLNNYKLSQQKRFHSSRTLMTPCPVLEGIEEDLAVLWNIWMKFSETGRSSLCNVVSGRIKMLISLHQVFSILEVQKNLLASSLL